MAILCWAAKNSLRGTDTLLIGRSQYFLTELVNWQYQLKDDIDLYSPNLDRSMTKWRYQLKDNIDPESPNFESSMANWRYQLKDDLAIYSSSLDISMAYCWYQLRVALALYSPNLDSSIVVQASSLRRCPPILCLWQPGMPKNVSKNVRQNVGIIYFQVSKPVVDTRIMRIYIKYASYSKQYISYFFDWFRQKSWWKNLAYLICSIQSSECFLRDWDCRVSVQLLPGARQAPTHSVFSVFNSLIYVYLVYIFS